VATATELKEIIKAKRATSEQASSVCREDLASTEDGIIPTETKMSFVEGARETEREF
jgi:hypothetical protein